jgi:formylglycine-generating enzyme required for sulfatase activity
MARLALLLVSLLSPLLGMAQKSSIDDHLKETGPCGRCHVASVLEWAMSRHADAGTTCSGCHGESKGHVKNERNNVKPDRVPRQDDIAALCVQCHEKGCPKSANVAHCQSCHHVHALIDPRKPVPSQDQQVEKLLEAAREFDRQMTEGERLLKLERWDQARTAFQAAAVQWPGNRRASELLKLCQRHLKSGLAGFEAVGQVIDPPSGLPLQVRVSRLGIEMVLIPGGDVDLGSELFAASKPIHTVRVEPFYLARHELTQGEWKTLMGANPSQFQGQKYPDSDRMPVERVSWSDCQQLIRKLNERVPGGGFRLPTEAEWECAIRADRPVASDLNAVAVFDLPDTAFASRPVGSKKPGKLGLFDMQGNVWEWCSTLSRPYPYDARDGRESLVEPGLRILRGGSFADTADLLDPAFRHAARPQDRLPWNGLRLARSVRP